MNRLSFFYDISGRVSKNSQFDKLFTVGGIIIPTEDVNIIETLVSKNTPKWKNATPKFLSSIAEILKNNNIYCTVIRILKVEPAWSNFWDIGMQHHQSLSLKTNLKTGFIKSANVLKYWAINKCAGTGLGLYIKSQGKPRILDASGFSILNIKIVCDTDIQGIENRDMFKENLEHWCKTTKMSTLLKIKPYLDSVEFKTEQQEQILLLADYLAGYVYYSSNPKTITPPKNLSQHDIEQFKNILEILKNSNRFNLIEYKFNEIFPNLTSTPKQPYT